MTAFLQELGPYHFLLERYQREYSLYRPHGAFKKYRSSGYADVEMTKVQLLQGGAAEPLMRLVGQLLEKMASLLQTYDERSYLEGTFPPGDLQDLARRFVLGS